MSQKMQKHHGDNAGQIADFLPAIVRKKMTQSLPAHVGASYFYEVGPGWEVKVLQEDTDIVQARTSLDLERAFQNPDVRYILIARPSSITRNIAMRVCRRHGIGKTVFFEVTKDE